MKTSLIICAIVLLLSIIALSVWAAGYDEIARQSLPFRRRFILRLLEVLRWI